jgi:hypothetical protein
LKCGANSGSCIPVMPPHCIRAPSRMRGFGPFGRFDRWARVNLSPSRCADDGGSGSLCKRGWQGGCPGVVRTRNQSRSWGNVARPVAPCARGPRLWRPRCSRVFTRGGSGRAQRDFVAAVRQYVALPKAERRRSKRPGVGRIPHPPWLFGFASPRGGLSRGQSHFGSLPATSLLASWRALCGISAEKSGRRKKLHSKRWRRGDRNAPPRTVHAPDRSLAAIDSRS